MIHSIRPMNGKKHNDEEIHDGKRKEGAMEYVNICDAPQGLQSDWKAKPGIKYLKRREAAVNRNLVY